jgi:hypothetical protein
MSRRLTDEEIAERYSQQYRVETPQAGLSELGGSAIDRMQAKGYGLLEPFGLSRDYRLAQEAEAQRTSKRYYETDPNAVGSYKNISGVGDVGRYAAELGVQSLPEMVPVIGAGLVGGPAAAFGVAGLSGIGEVMQAQREQTGRTDATSVPLGLAYGGVEAATGIVGKFAGTGIRAERAAAAANKYLDNLGGFTGGVARTGAAFTRTGLSEAAGEVGQEYISNVGRLAVDPRVDLFSPEAMDEYAESFVGGGLLGGLVGGVTGGWRRSQGFRDAARERDLTSTDTTQQPLVQRPDDSQFVTQDQTLGLQKFINQNTGVTRPKRGNYVEQFKAAYDEPTGQYVSDPVTGVERQLTVGELLQREQAPLDMTQEKPADAAATAQVVAATVRDPRSYELRDTFGVIPTPSSLQLYSELQASGIPLDSDLLVGVWAYAGEKPMNQKRLEKAQQMLDAAIIESRKEATSGTGISTVQQPAGGVGVGSPVVQGGVGNAGPATPVAGAVVGGTPAVGGALQQTSVLPVAPGQPSTPVTTGAPSGPQAPQTIQTAPQGQTTTTRGAAGTTALVDTSDDALEIARATGNASEIEAMREDEAGLRVDQRDFTEADLNDLIDEQLGKGKNKERDRKILRAYILSRRMGTEGAKGDLVEEIASTFGITEDRVRQIGNPEKLARLAVEKGFDKNQVFDLLGIESAQKKIATKLGKLEGELTRLKAKAKPTKADIALMAELDEQITRINDEVEAGDMAAAFKEAGIEGEAGEAFGNLDDAREWQKASTAGSQMAVKLVSIADTIAELQAAAAELKQLGLTQAEAAAAERVNELTAEYQAIVSSYEAKPEAEAATPKGGKGKGKGKAAEKAAEEKDAANEAEAAKYRAERAAKLQADRNGLAVGDTVKNPKLGTGVVKSFAGDGDATTVTVAFQSGQTKELSVKLAKLEKVDAVQVESAASVPVQPKAETGEKVGRQVRRAPKPATESKAPTVILTQAEQAAEAWDKVAADFPEAPKFADLTKGQQNTFIGFGPDNWERGDVELELTKLARAAAPEFLRKSRQSTRLFSTDLYLGKENMPGQPQYGRELRNPVTLADGTRLDGFTSPDQSVFSGYDRNGQRVTVSQSSIDPADIKSSRDSNRTANALKAALGTTRKSRRSVRTADQSGVEFESVEASLEDLSNYSEGIAAGIRSLRNSGMGNAVDAIDSWMVTFSPVSWDAIYTMIDGKRTIIYNGVILKDKILATTATLHEVGHGIDEVQTGAGKFSNDKEFKLSRVNGELMSMRPGTVVDELLTHWEDASETSALGGMLNYPFDMTDSENRSLTMQELREEVFAQVWAFSNMNGGMDYLRDNLPTTFAFMEKAHEQVKATNYKRAQSTQQGAQSGQVQAGQQNAQPAGAILRASRQAKQGLIDRNIAKLPKQSQQPVKNLTAAIGDLGGKYLDYALFTNDLVKRAQALGLGAAKTFSDRLAARNAKVSEEERKIEKIADGYALIEDENKGSGPGSVNEFIFESTRTGKWGYNSGTFKADPAMKAMFENLKPKAQQFVKDVFAHGDAMLASKKRIVLNATNSEYDAMIKSAQDNGDTDTEAKLKAEKAATLKRFQTLFRIREGLPYAPIKRTGTYAVVGESAAYQKAKADKNTALIQKLESDPNHYNVSFVDTKWAGRNLEASMADEYPDLNISIIKRAEAMDDFSRTGLMPALTKMRSFVTAQNTREDGKIDPSAGKLLGIINQLYLEALAEGSARKSEMRRRGIAGEVDMLQSFTQQGRADANFLASVEYEPKIQDALQQMRNQSRTGDRERKSEIFDELTQRYADSLDPKPSPFINGITNMASKFFLASSPGYYIQNLTQPFMMSLPAMAGRYDYTKAGKALFDAYAELGPLFKDVKLFDQQFDFSKVPADVREAINDLVNQGKIDIGLATEINEYKVDADGKLGQFAQRLNKGMRMAVQKVEATNRLATAIAAYRLEFAETKDATKATQYAADILTDTHGDYTAFNAPRAFNTQWGKVALQFRKFQLIQIAFYAKLFRDIGRTPEERAAAIKTLMFSLSHSAVFAGAMGLPGYAAVAALLSFFGDEDEKFDLTAKIRDLVGPEWADMVTRGAPTLVGMDLSGKIGSGNMLSIMPFSDADLSTTSGMVEYFGGAVGGAALGMTTRIADGLLLMAKGDYYKGVERVMPKGVSDALKAGRQAAEGMTRRNGDVVLPDSEVSALDTVWTAMGIAPVKQTVTYERQNRLNDMTQNFNDRTKRIKNDFTKAARNKDSDGMAQAREAWTKLQQARKENGLKPQPMSSLLKAPQEQKDREKRTVGGVQYREGQKKLAESIAEE